MKRGVILDRRLVLELLIGRQSLRSHTLETIQSFDYIAYDATGMSGLEMSLRELPGLSRRLVGMRLKDEVEEIRSPEFYSTIRAARINVSIVQAEMLYHRTAANQHFLPGESVTYTYQLLAWAREMTADIALHGDRLQILTNIFGESGVRLTEESTAGREALVSQPCGFPHLPSSTSGDYVYRVLPCGRAEEDEKTRHESRYLVSNAEPGPADAAGCPIFIAYSHQDSVWLERLTEILRPLERRGLIDAWSDTRIRPGDTWMDEINASISQAHAAVLIVSSSFLASDFISKVELPRILFQHAAQRMTVAWFPASASLYQYTEIGQFQALSPPGKPLSEMSPARRQRELVKIAEAILGMAND